MSKQANRAKMLARKCSDQDVYNCRQSSEDDEQMPDPRMSARDWAEWLFLTSQLEEAEEISR